MIGTHVPASELAVVIWKKSGRSAHMDGCVEAGSFAGGVVIRNSKAWEVGGLLFTAEEWIAFLGGAQDGDFDHLIE